MVLGWRMSMVDVTRIPRVGSESPLKVPFCHRAEPHNVIPRVWRDLKSWTFATKTLVLNMTFELCSFVFNFCFLHVLHQFFNLSISETDPFDVRDSIWLTHATPAVPTCTSIVEDTEILWWSNDVALQSMIAVHCRNVMSHFKILNIIYLNYRFNTIYL